MSKTISGTTTQFLYDGWNPVQELAPSTPPLAPVPTANLLTGLGIDEYFQRSDSVNGTLTFLNDALGSSLALTNSSGAITTSYMYEPFGKVSVTNPPLLNGNSYQFTGRENDGTGLYFYRARYYSPTFQRFIAQDRLDFRGGGPNLYGYVVNDPINAIDPRGLKITPACPGTCPPTPPGNNPDWQPDATADWSVSLPRRLTHPGQSCYEAMVGDVYLHCCYDQNGLPIYGDNGSAWEDYNPNLNWRQWFLHSGETFWYAF